MLCLSRDLRAFCAFLFVFWSDGVVPEPFVGLCLSWRVARSVSLVKERAPAVRGRWLPRLTAAAASDGPRASARLCLAGGSFGLSAAVRGAGR